MRHMLKDFRHSVRQLRRTPAFTAVAVLVLALGIGANTAVFSLVNALVLQPRPGRVDQAYGVFSHDRVKQDRYQDFSYPAYVDLRDRGGVFDQLMAHTFSTVGIREGDTTKQTFASIVSANYFQTLGVTLAAGRPFTLDEERPGAKIAVAVASYSMWRKAGLSPSFIGSTIQANGTAFTVVGVAPRSFAGTMTLVSPQWFFPLGSYDTIVNEMFKQRASGLTDRGNYALNLAGQLRPGVTKERAEQALEAVARQLDTEFPGTDRDRTFVLAKLSRMGVSSRPQTDGPITGVSGLLMLMAVLVLVVACLNLANLLLARGAARRREIAIRQALGSGRRRIVQQLVVEGLTLALAGAAVGVVMGWWTTNALAAWLGSILPLGIEVVIVQSWRVVGAAAAFATLSTLFFALGPAWSLSRPTVAGDLKNESAGVTRRSKTGSFLVIGQLAVSLALVAAGGLFVRAAINVTSADPGYSLDRQLVIGLDASLAGYNEARVRSVYRSVLQAVRSTPGVERASFASTVAFGSMTEGRTVKLAATDEGVPAIFDVIGAEYFETLGVPVVRGREFTRAEEEAGPGAKLAIIDRRLARKLFAESEPIGRPVLMSPREGEQAESFIIVGIAPELKHDLFDLEAEPHVYVPYGQKFNTMMNLHIVTAPGAPSAAMLSTLRQELLHVDARLPIIDARTMVMHRDLSISAWSVRAAAALFSTFGALALLLATIGVYGLKAYDVSRRTREIGIRIALGATTGDVSRLILREGARTTIVGLAIGLLLAAGLGKLLSGILYKVSPVDPMTIVAATMVLTTAALLACYIPARRATRVAPLEALRTE
uniref:Permease n=1 Tax=uncultured bacterium 59 TaxID=698390 RepID=E3T6H6_9BACT|nr:permease [uncultured bacterium 59]